MSHKNLCCAHPQQRIDSPEPPPRLPFAIDSILIAAALPEDHPYALKFVDKKPEEHVGIIRSPNVANKIKQHFRRRSLKALRNDEQYDDDVQPMTSTEAVYTLGYVPHEGTSRTHVKLLSRQESQDDFRVSVLNGLDWLKPLLSRYALYSSYFHVS